MRKMEQHSWRFPNIPGTLKKIVIATLQGKLLMRMRVDEFFPQIAFSFAMLLLIILFNLAVDNQLARMEENKKTLAELELINTQKQYDLIMLERRTNVSYLLKQKNSDVAEPVKPAIVIK